jgi:hypothetical protein
MKQEAQPASHETTGVQLDVSAPTLPIDAGITPGGRAPIVWYQRATVQRRVRLLVRLVGMTPAEIVHRIGRATRKRLRRRRAVAVVSLARPAALLPAAMAADPSAFLRAQGATRGFFDLAARERLAAACRTTCPADVARTLAAADAVLEHGIELLGRHFAPCAPDFDWHADPERGRLWPATVLDDADAVRRVRADVKFVWEVNRHQFLVTLARAHAYSGDERYAGGVVAMIRGWIAANPHPVGVNWASNLEVAVRALSWMWALHFLAGTPVADADTLRLWLAALRQHRDHLADHLSTFTDATNHLIGEAAALAAITLWLPAWERSAELQALALGTLARELERQVGDDGVDHEQATSYQRFVLDFVLQVIVLAERSGTAIPPIIRARAAAMLEAIGVLVGASGRVPRLGDSDDARGLPFFTAEPWDFSELLALGARILGRHALAAGRSGTNESVVWATASSPADHTDADPPALRSVLLPDGGYAVLRSALHPTEDRLVFDCGPLGYLPHASHGHADLLSVLVDVGGEEMLVDPGSFAYFDEAGRRDLFRSTRMHNTVEIGGRDQADAFDPFKWLNIPRCGRSAVRLSDDLDYVEAWHDGYRRLRPAVRHRRAVLGVGGAWLVIDWLEGKGEHTVARYFHAAPGVETEPASDDAIRLRSPSRRIALLVRDLRGAATGRPEITPGAYSELYGRMTWAPVVRMVERMALPALRLTLLVPERAAASLGVEDMVGDVAAGALWLRLRDGRSCATDVAVRVPDGPTRVGPLMTDAAAVVMCESASSGGAVVLRSGGSRATSIRTA